ncbi:MAG: hypothetical protein AAF548_19915 [Actinomycetota bacterium]
MHRITAPALAIVSIAIAAVVTVLSSAVVADDAGQAVAFEADGVSLAGHVDDAFGATATVSCGEVNVVDAADVITSDPDISGAITVDGVAFDAVTTEIQVVRSGDAVVCIDAEGTLHDSSGDAVGTWRVRPDHTGAPSVTTALH